MVLKKTRMFRILLLSKILLFGLVQPRGENKHAVFFTHGKEAITYNYERNPEDPRISHMMTLEVDDFGNILKQVQIGYGRESSDLIYRSKKIS